MVSIGRVELIELRPRLQLLRFEVGQAYLWQDGDSLTLIDTGPVGSGEAIASAVRKVGGELARIVLTHAHGDHTGSAAEILQWSAPSVLAHRVEAPLIRGEQAIPPPNLLDWERPLFEQVSGHLSAPPCPVTQELEDGDVVDFGGGAQVLAIPGHTAGSIAIHLPEQKVLFTGDTVAEYNGDVIVGVFNLDHAETARSVRRLAALPVELACPGHGTPFTNASARLTSLVQSLPG